MKLYKDFNSHLRETFGCRVQKITVDAGLNCPNRDGTISTAGCIYCNARGSGTGAFHEGLSVKQQLIQGKTVLSKRYKAQKFIAYFQSFSNTYASFNRLKHLYDEALSVEGIVGLSIGTRPDCVNDRILSLLQHYAQTRLIWIEYGLQSASDLTLKLINRGHDFNCFKNAVELTQGRGIRICVHVILGLPNETPEDMLRTAQALANLGVDGIKIHLLYVIKNTKMETLYQQGNYRCLTREEYAERVCDFLEVLPENMVIQRLTGDPHREELVAPLWALEKSKNLSYIQSLLERRGTWQGKFFQSL
ncbi:MAG: TIGR01212 family radical SAM protein [Desulfobacterales bacterium]